MTFPTTLADWVGIITNPLFGAFLVFVVFRILNKKDNPLTIAGKALTITGWSDLAKLIFAFVLVLFWSIGVTALGKEFVNFTPDTWPLIIARAAGVFGGNQLVYLVVANALGPAGSKFLTGGATTSDLISGALNPPPPVGEAG